MKNSARKFQMNVKSSFRISESSEEFISEKIELIGLNWGSDGGSGGNGVGRGEDGGVGHLLVTVSFT